MDPRTLLVGLALVLLCVGPVHGDLSSTGLVVSDEMIDIGGARVVSIGIQITTTASGSSTTPTICGTPSVAPFTWESTDTGTGCDSTSCTQVVLLHVSSTTTCSLSGSYTLSFEICSSGTPSSAAATFDFILHARSLCVSDTSYSYSVAANISSFGAFADAGFSHTKSHYLINDVVYFPFQVVYNDLTIATLTFNTISVESDGSNAPVVLYSSSTPVSTTVVNLQTSAPVSQLTTGSAVLWFSLQLNREQGSPFANAASSVTPYTFSVIFDITYKHAKRALQLEGAQLRSEATIMLTNKEAPSALLSSPNVPRPLHALPTGAANSLRCGVVGIASLLLFAFFGF